MANEDKKTAEKLIRDCRIRFGQMAGKSVAGFIATTMIAEGFARRNPQMVSDWKEVREYIIDENYDPKN